MTDRLWLADPWRSRLTQHGLSTLNTFLHWSDGQLVSTRENGLDTFRIELRSDTAPLLVGYLKRYGGYRGHWSYFRHTGRLRREAAALLWLHERSFNVPPLLAWGVRSRWGVVTASFLLTAEVQGAETLDARWRRSVSMDGGDRSRLLTRLAAVIGRMHREEFIHGNLYGRNILVTTATDDPYLIDFPGCRIKPLWPIGAFGMVRDLSGFLADLDPISPEETTSFLAGYGEARWPDHTPEERVRRVDQLTRRIVRHTTARRIRLELEEKKTR